MTLRVLHVLDHSLPLHSGYAFRTAAILREQRALGWDTFHLTTPRQGPSATWEETAGGWHFYRTPRAPLAGVPGVGLIAEMARTAGRIDQIVAEVRPDILHAHSPVLNALPALWIGRKRGLPVVYELRASWEDAAVDHGTTREGSVRYRLSRALESFALRRADAITTICEGLRSDIAARGIERERIVLIPNAVDTESFPGDDKPDEALRAKLGLQEATVLGFAGSFYAYEGLDVLVEALARLAASRPEVKALLVGGGSHEPDLRDRVQALGIADRVVFTGRVPNAEVGRYYDLMDILVYPRRSMRLTELVTPLKPLEAMAQRRLVLASDVGGHRELIKHGVNGFLFPAGDPEALAAAVAELLDARASWSAVRARARRFVETERTWRRSVSAYVDVYGQLTRTRLAPVAS